MLVPEASSPTTPKQQQQQQLKAQADEAELLTAFAAHPRIGDIELLRARYATGSATANAE